MTFLPFKHVEVATWSPQQSIGFLFSVSGRIEVLFSLYESLIEVSPSHKTFII